MTGHWNDFKNSDVLLACGSNNAENHPESARWVGAARDKGAINIVVDPRYTRTAAVADYYCPIRPGTDIAFWGGMVNYIIENDKWQKEYVLNYTNASYLIDPAYNFDVETGLFSGWDAEKGQYVTSSWGYQTETVEEPNTSAGGAFAYVLQEGTPEFTPPSKKVPKKDMTLTDPQCSFNKFKEHYARYDIDTVTNICGMDKESLETVYEIYASTGAPERVGAILYALGQTQHHYGSQNTRIMSLVQLLLGNVGVPGGSVNALRGEPNVQGATDAALLVYDFPGYLKWPTVEKHASLRKWLETETLSDGYYTNKPKFFISALKEWYGDNATVENDFGYDWLPKIGKDLDFTTMSTFEHMDSGLLKGYFCWGMNPANSTANTKFAREAMSKLDWLVAVDWVETESACFWKAPDLDPATIQTECYFLPAALIYEKMGSIVNSGRWIQWRYKAVDPVDLAKPDYEICDLLWREIVRLYQEEGGACPEAILNVKWDYTVDGKFDPRCVSMALNGYKWADTWEDRELLSTFGDLAADGSTACAMWIYSGFYANNDAKFDPSEQNVGGRSREDKTDLGLYPGWAYAWPLNRRILYNRASADMEGKPWNPERNVVEWNGSEWITNDVPDFAFKKQVDGKTEWIAPNNKAFMMTWEQVGRFVCSTMKDMPLPEHYEPFESRVDNKLNGRQNSPCIMFADRDSVRQSNKEDHPIVATTYSVVEMWQSGSQTRGCPVLVESRPEQFIEMSVELAEEKGIANGDVVRVWNDRGDVKVSAFVTRRIKPLEVDGEVCHVVGMIHHWGWAGTYSTGDTVNDLTPNVGDPNSYIPEYKAFLVNVEKA